MGLFSKLQDRYSLACLNAAQFFGVLNDNIFKLVLVYLMIEVLGYQKAPKILSAAGATFVIPFLLFSSSAGILADRFSKQRLLVFMKIAEYVKRHSAPNDRIFVWGFATMIYFFSERAPASRFFSADLLVGRPTGTNRADTWKKDTSSLARPEAWAAFMTMLRNA